MTGHFNFYIFISFFRTVLLGVRQNVTHGHLAVSGAQST